MTLQTLKIEFLSDWHIGSGNGRSGSIDRLVKRDRWGLPFIPAKTLTGILRDACELVAISLDYGTESSFWQQWIDYLFGDEPALEKGAKQQAPKPAAFSVRSAHFPSDFCQAIRHKPLLKESLTFIKPGVEIDPNSGTAKPDFLRFEEMARVGAVLSASCELAAIADAEQQATAQALLIAGATFVERLGAKRRRGAGRCKLEFENADLKGAIAQLEKSQLPTPPKFERELITVESAIAPDHNWYSLDLRLTTKSPLTIHKRTTGNVVETLDYIPGTCLIPILSQKLRTAEFNIGTAIANRHFIITHATPEVENTQGLPVPFAFAKEKLNEAAIYNKFKANLDDAPQVKNFRSGYINATQSATMSYCAIDTEVETHNTVEDKSQRPSEEVGGVYSYEAVPPGQTFRAQLRLQRSLFNQNGAALPEVLRSLLQTSATVQIGRTKKDDYGWVELEFVEASVLKQSNVSNELTVWLLSDVLLRDHRLRPTTRLEDLTKALERELDTTLELSDPSFARHRRTDSWQTRWGLPRPSLIGLSAGTCLTFKLKSAIDPSRLDELETKGIGERTAEGYGQLRFNAPVLMVEKPELEKVQPEQEISDDFRLIEDAYARVIEQAAWRESMRRAALAIASNPTQRKQILGFDSNQKKPTMSQLGGLRSRLQQLTINDIATFQQWLTKLRKKRLDRWTEKSLNELDQLLQQPDLIWQHYTRVWQEALAIDSPTSLTLTQTGEATLKRELWLEAIQTLVDACIRAHKRDCEPSSKESQ